MFVYLHVANRVNYIEYREWKEKTKPESMLIIEHHFALHSKKGLQHRRGTLLGPSYRNKIRKPDELAEVCRLQLV